MHEIYNLNQILVGFDNVKKKIIEYSSKTNSTLRLQLINKLRFEDKCEQHIFELLLEHALKAETISAGGFDIFIDELLVSTARSTAKTLDEYSLNLIVKTFAGEDSEHLLLDCFKLAGLKGKIILSQHPVNGDSDLIEVNTGCFFPDLVPAFDVKYTKFLNAKIACVDGFVESVSELNRLLNDAAQQKETVILFLRGLSDEVLHTLKVNYDRGSLQVIPVIVRYDLDGANLLNDIATTCCSDVISSLKGQLISSIDLALLNRVENIDITSSGTLIENSIAANNIDLHIKKLQEKINSSTNEYEKEILTKRIQNMGSHRVTIRLKNDSQKKLRSLQIDRVLRAIKVSTTHGTCLWKDKLYPYSSVLAGKFFIDKFKDTMNNLGAIVSQPAPKAAPN